MIVLTAQYRYRDRAHAPPDHGGWWRFFELDADADEHLAPSLTINENQFDALGRPNTITLLAMPTPGAAPVP